MAFKCSSTTPPCPCMMPFGSPVVPEENRIHSGWSKSTGTGVQCIGVGLAR